MKAILVIDIPTDCGDISDNKATIKLQNEKLMKSFTVCNVPLKPMSEEKIANAIPISFLKDKIALNESWGCYGYAKGLQSAIDEWEKYNESNTSD